LELERGCGSIPFVYCASINVASISKTLEDKSKGVTSCGTDWGEGCAHPKYHRIVLAYAIIPVPGFFPASSPVDALISLHPKMLEAILHVETSPTEARSYSIWPRWFSTSPLSTTEIRNLLFWVIG